MIIFQNTLFLTHSFFSSYLSFFSTSCINFFWIFCSINNNFHLFRLNFSKALTYGDNILFTICSKSTFTTDNGCNHWFVVCKNTVFTIYCWQHNTFARTIIKTSITGCYFKIKFFCHKSHLFRHYASIVLAFSMTSSIVPAKRKAASGYSSISPLIIALKPLIVSFNGTYLPLIPVKTSPTENG